MKGYALGAGEFGAREFASRELRPEEVRIQVEFVCLENADTDGICPGGGLVGTVVACGDAATAFMGQRVLASEVIACGECDTCRRGAATVCPNRELLGVHRHGGCAEHVVCSGRWLTRSTETLAIEGPIAALAAGPGLRAYALFCRAGATAGDVVVVLGTSATAHIVAKLATVRGAKVVRAGAGDEVAIQRDVAAGLEAQDCANRPLKLLVCDGEANLAVAVEIAPPASIVATAIGGGRISAATLQERELSLVSLAYGHPDLLPETAALVVKGELDLGDVLKQAQLGSDSLVSSREAIKEGKCLVVHH